MEANDAKWSSLQWRKRLETFGSDDGPVIAAGPRGEVDGICDLGELTDIGRYTTWDLGRRLRYLYVDQLHFLSPMIKNADSITSTVDQGISAGIAWVNNTELDQNENAAWRI